MLDAVEDDTAEYHHHQHKAKTIQQVVDIHRARAQEGIAESLDDGRHWVGEDDPLEARGDGRDRVNDRGGVHQQGNAKGHQEAQVAVFGG